MTELTAKTALVVGGYGGIGAAISRELALQGAFVAIAGRSADQAGKLAGELSPDGSGAIGLAMDICSSESIGTALADLAARRPNIDIMVNCASALKTYPAEQFPEEDFRTIVEANLTGAFLLSQQVGRRMIDAGTAGRLVHLSSVRGAAGARRGFTAYGASKAGLNLLVRQLATEWGRHGITVNAVAPGFVRTEFVEQANSDQAFVQQIRNRIPLGRFAEPEEIAGAVRYLVSPVAAFVTGQILYVDGGVTASQ